MTDAPERIWVDTDCFLPPLSGITAEARKERKGDCSTPYLRADLVPSWQPIETAPKSERILLGRKDTPEEEWVAEGMWVAYPDLQGEEDGHWSILNPFISTMPTHWMPLPEPPK